MKAAQFLALFVALFLVGCEKKTPQAAATNSTSGNPLTAPVDYLGALDNGRRRSISTIDIAQITQAVQMFNAEHDRFPKDLNELIDAKLLVKVPAAPYGMKIDYDPNTGAVKVVKDPNAPPPPNN